MVKSTNRRWWILSGALAFSWAAINLFAQEQPEQPRIILAVPLAVSPGNSTTLTLRGLKLEETSRVVISGVEGLTELTLKKKEKTPLPSQVDAKEAGDTQVEVELSMPAGFVGAAVSIMLETPVGKTAPYELLVLPAGQPKAETEPNGGFRQAQALERGERIQGAIQQQRDVDVYRFSGKAGQPIVIEVVAHHRGSTLDGLLTLYDARGALLASADDVTASGSPPLRDPVINCLLPADGQYFLTLIDAHDRGGPTHPYLLQIR